jgi:hypothetical protein
MIGALAALFGTIAAVFCALPAMVSGAAYVVGGGMTHKMQQDHARRQAEANRREAMKRAEIARLEEIQAATGRGQWVKTLHPMANVGNLLYRTQDGNVRRYLGFDPERSEWFIPDPIEYFPALHCHMTVIDRPTTIPEVKR